MLFPCIQMPNERFLLAVSRLEAALARIEAVATPPAPGVDAADFAALVERHGKLRAGTAEALARLDTLLETAGGR